MIYKQVNQKLDMVLGNIEKVIIGKRDIAELSHRGTPFRWTCLIGGCSGRGEDSLGKGTGEIHGCSFKRIQFTPDLLPSDVTGVSIFNPKEQEFIFRPGPIMGHIILADEINRTSPKTQSALLEAMEEASVTVDGVTRRLETAVFRHGDTKSD